MRNSSLTSTGMDMSVSGASSIDCSSYTTDCKKVNKIYKSKLTHFSMSSLASLWIREGEKEEKALSIVVAPACSFDALTDFGQPGRKKKRLPPGACKPLHHDVIPYSVIVYFFFKLYCVSLISQKKVWLCAVAKPIQYRYRNLIPLVAFFFVVSFSKTYKSRVFCFFH